jgi:cell division protein FtsQ
MCPSMFRSRRNRRKVDLARKTSEVKASVRSHGPAVLKALLVTALTTGAAYGAVCGWRWATTTDAFAMKRVQVSGGARVTEAQVWRLGGLVAGTNLVAMDVAAVERAVATHPWVRVATVSRALPDALVVRLVEHEPVALLALTDLYLLDADGEPFKRAQASEAVDLPLVTGIGRDALVGRRDETRAVIRRALHAAEAYGRSPASKGHPVSEVNVGPDLGLTLVTANGEALVLGEVDVERALERLARVRRELEARQLSAEVIRLDNRTRPDWVAVRASAVRSGRGP